ncbi:NADPH-dependent 7-cyano-7-deazaguanine reductase QueF [Facilibium subflavum]|uniref:NADPH-dependent 7-cyano-7-deazaguanine reductase QueF n=1 Tax=Facilibium subflavum TaxID=2219058 RepID=UPI000E65AA53|nr:NADPH-dependent 7-cyano-7-deazaguanine reductase QueF [Facilibium subflavum]
MDLTLSELGKKSAYLTQYDSTLLFPIPRLLKRQELGITGKPQFKGVDIWSAFEISWLNQKGKPEVRIGLFEIDAASENLIESKSFKLYLNSFNNTPFDDESQVKSIMQNDLSKAVNGVVNVQLIKLKDYAQRVENCFSGQSLDDLDVEITEYVTNPDYLAADSQEIVEETLTSDLLKSNCLVTEQPDWGSVLIYYQGNKIDHEGLLKYIISFRNHNEFHEQCVERIFTDIMQKCKPQKLLVYARYTRRGGLDINPLRCNFNDNGALREIRLARQ